MSAFRIVLSLDARTQILSIARWWRANRPKNPGLFFAELKAATNRLSEAPRAGVLYKVPRVEGVRRLLLPRTGYYLYYTVNDAASVVEMVAVWHTARGGGPL